MAENQYKIIPQRSGTVYPYEYRATAEGARKRAEALVEHWVAKLGEVHRPTSVVVYRRDDSKGTWGNQAYWDILAVLEVGKDGQRWVAGDDARRIESQLVMAKTQATVALTRFRDEMTEFGVTL